MGSDIIFNMNEQERFIRPTTESTRQMLFGAFDRAEGRCMNWARNHGSFESISFTDYSYMRDGASSDGTVFHIYTEPADSFNPKIKEFDSNEDVTTVLISALMSTARTRRKLQGFLNARKPAAHYMRVTSHLEQLQEMAGVDVSSETAVRLGEIGLLLARDALFDSFIAPGCQPDRLTGKYTDGRKVQIEDFQSQIPGVEWRIYRHNWVRTDMIRIDKVIPPVSRQESESYLNGLEMDQVSSHTASLLSGNEDPTTS